MFLLVLQCINQKPRDYCVICRVIPKLKALSVKMPKQRELFLAPN